MRLRVTLLGTGGSAGVPHIGGDDGLGDWGACDASESRNRRTRTSILVEQDGQALLVDTSPDMRTQLLDCAVRRVDAVLYTHAHADHVTGIDDVRILNRIAARPLEALASEATLSELQRRFAYAFRPWEPPYFFRPVLLPRAVAFGEDIDVIGMRMRVYDQDHGFTRTLGLRIGPFGYSTDVVSLDEAGFAALEGIDTWVVGCFQRAPHRTHAWVARVCEWAERLRPRRTVLTHMGNDMDWDWLSRHLPPGIEPGHDGQVLEIEA